MKREARRAAVAVYKERKARGGVFAVRCSATGEAWVGSSKDLDKIQNRIWFMLKQNSSPHRSMQAAWNEHGADNLAFEVLEELPADTSDLVRGDLLKKRAAHWQGELGAHAA